MNVITNLLCETRSFIATKKWNHKRDKQINLNQVKEERGTGVRNRVLFLQLSASVRTAKILVVSRCLTFLS